MLLSSSQNLSDASSTYRARSGARAPQRMRNALSVWRRRIGTPSTRPWARGISEFDVIYLGLLSGMEPFQPEDVESSDLAKRLNSARRAACSVHRSDARRANENAVDDHHRGNGRIDPEHPCYQAVRQRRREERNPAAGHPAADAEVTESKAASLPPQGSNSDAADYARKKGRHGSRSGHPAWTFTATATRPMASLSSPSLRLLPTSLTVSFTSHALLCRSHSTS
jgi:hypothetical protein